MHPFGATPRTSLHFDTSESTTKPGAGQWTCKHSDRAGNYCAKYFPITSREGIRGDSQPVGCRPIISPMIFDHVLRRSASTRNTQVNTGTEHGGCAHTPTYSEIWVHSRTFPRLQRFPTMFPWDQPAQLNTSTGQRVCLHTHSTRNCTTGQHVTIFPRSLWRASCRQTSKHNSQSRQATMSKQNRPSRHGQHQWVHTPVTNMHGIQFVEGLAISLSILCFTHFILPVPKKSLSKSWVTWTGAVWSFTPKICLFTKCLPCFRAWAFAEPDNRKRAVSPSHFPAAIWNTNYHNPRL